MESMEKFNKLTGLIFARLYAEFPVSLELEPVSFLEASIDEDDGDGAFSFPDYFRSTVKWLERADYIWITQDNTTFDGPSYEVVLSERGLEILRQIPSVLEGNTTLGERFVDFSKSKASDAIGTLISLAVTSGVQGT